MHAKGRRAGQKPGRGPRRGAASSGAETRPTVDKDLPVLRVRQKLLPVNLERLKSPHEPGVHEVALHTRGEEGVKVHATARIAQYGHSHRAPEGHHMGFRGGREAGLPQQGKRARRHQGFTLSGVDWSIANAAKGSENPSIPLHLEDPGAAAAGTDSRAQ